ncbi:MAG: hypothetical protein WAX69_23615 [Victivallales bacterium]
MNSARNVNSISILTGFLFVISLCSYSQEDSSKKAEEILGKAKGNMIGEGDIKSFIAEDEEILEDKSRLITRYYKKFNQDGTSWYRMEDITVDSKNKQVDISVYLENDEGSWKIIGDVAIKRLYVDKISKDAAEKVQQKTEKEIFTYGYEVKDVKINNIDCYQITEKILGDKSFFKLTRYIIDKASSFVYSQAYFDKLGRKTSELLYKNVKLNVSLDDKIFKVDDSFRILIANTVDEFLSFEKKAEEQSAKDLLNKTNK